MKIVFIGMNHEYSLTPLRALAERFGVVGVIESIHPKWNYRHGSWLKRIARRRSIPYCTMDRKTHPQEFLQQARPDLICIAGMLQLLRPDEWFLARLGAINLHPSLLPNYRGPEVFFWQAQRMDLDGGVTVFQIDEGIDTGDILAQERVSIPLGEDYDDVVGRTIDAGVATLIRCVQGLDAGTIQPTPQRHLPCPFPARPITPEDHAIDWHAWPIERVWHFLRASPILNPTLKLPPIKGRWSFGGMIRCACTDAPGTCCNDDGGYYLAHPEGKIRLDVIRKPSLARRMVDRIRRALAEP